MFWLLLQMINKRLKIFYLILVAARVKETRRCHCLDYHTSQNADCRPKLRDTHRDHLVQYLVLIYMCVVAVINLAECTESIGDAPQAATSAA